MKMKMSSECEKCGEHSLECKCKFKFYYKDKYFLEFDEFQKSANEWQFIKINQETFFTEWINLGISIWLNITLKEKKLSNKEFVEILNETFFNFLKKIIEKNE